MCRRASEQLRLAARRVVLGALCGRHDRIHRGRGARAVAFDTIERAGGGEAFQHPLVDSARIHAAAKIGKVGEGTLAARGDDALHRLPPDPAQRGQGVMDGVAVDLEFDLGAID
jgi:hypothetical protein